MIQWVKTHTEDIDISIFLAYEGYSYWEGVTLEDWWCLWFSSRGFQNLPRPKPLCYEISQTHMRRSSCLVGGCHPLGWRRKGLPHVGTSQQLLQLTFGSWSKRPALSGVNIKWWTFSSRAALYFCCQTDSRNTSASPDWYSQTLV